MMVTDLIYCGHDQYKECTNELKAEYPDAVTEDASDSIHGGRFSIEVQDVSQRDFRLFLMRRGYLEISLDLGLLRLDKHEECMELVEQVVEERRLLGIIP